MTPSSGTHGIEAGQPMAMDTRLRDLDKARMYARSVNTFTGQLGRHVGSGTDGNLIMSALGVHTVLGMLYGGAGQQSVTQRELYEVLQYSRFFDTSSALDTYNIDDTVADYYRAWHQQQNSVRANSSLILTVTNHMLLADTQHVDPQYLQTVHDTYGVRPLVADFSQPNTVIDHVNTWAAEQTHGKIKPLLGSIPPDCRVVLLNAIYFKGLWQTPFALEETAEPFYTQSHGAVQTRYMHRHGRFRLFENERLQMIDIPYRVGPTPRNSRADTPSVSMFVVLTKGNAVNNNVDALQERTAHVVSLDEVDEIIRHMSAVKNNVIVHLPRFKVESTTQLIPPCQALGLNDVFQGSANLSRIGAGLHVSMLMQKAFIAVDEIGTEAAAVTAGAAAGSAFPPSPAVFTADRPFMYLIRDNTIGTVLFHGHVTTLASSAS